VKPYKILFIILTALYSLLPALLYSQVDTAWVRRYDGPGNGEDYAYAIALDAQGNVYVTGQSTGDYATVKYTANGDTAWVRRYNSPSGNYEDNAWEMAVDVSGNVYVTGYSVGSGTDADYATIKYNSSGVEQWVARYHYATDKAYRLAIDGSGNVYVTGSSGTFPYLDYLTIKYNSNGETLWTRRYDGTANYHDEAFGIAVDSAGNLFITGYSYGAGSGYDIVTIKYNSAGVEQWVHRYNGPDNWDDSAYRLVLDTQGNIYVVGVISPSLGIYNIGVIKYNPAGDTVWVRKYVGPGGGHAVGHDIAVDEQGNVYVTGSSTGSGTYSDYTTIKYNADGDTLWLRRYNGPGNFLDVAHAIALDAQGNVYVTGGSIVSGNNTDYATIKYNSAGVEQWVQRYNGPGNNSDQARSLTIDGQSNIYVTGYSAGSGTGYDYATIKYNSAGVQEWVQRYNGTGNDWDVAFAIVVDGPGNVYVTGASIGSGTSSDYATIKYVQTQGINELMGSGVGELRVSVFPNPAKTYFNVRLPLSADRSEIKIFDVTGNIVKELESFGVRELRVSLDGIKNGVYFVKAGNEIIKEKLVITK